MEDCASGPQQVLFVGLKELVARVRYENVRERLARMSARRKTRALNHVRDLAAEQRDVGRIGAVGGGGKETQEPVLANDLTRGVEALDGEVIEISRPVHRRARRRLGQR